MPVNKYDSKYPYVFQIAKMQRVYVIGVQIIYLPVGIAMARLFHCNDVGKLDVDNSITCWEVLQVLKQILIAFGVS